jgi:hypothetical protein
MSQESTLQEFDALIASSMISSGMGDIGSYTPYGGGTSIDGISCLVDKVYAEFGSDAGAVGGTKTVITFYLSEVPVPTRLSSIQIGSRTWKLQELDAQDESMTRWVVVQ